MGGETSDPSGLLGFGAIALEKGAGVTHSRGFRSRVEFCPCPGIRRFLGSLPLLFPLLASCSLVNPTASPVTATMTPGPAAVRDGADPLEAVPRPETKTRSGNPETYEVRGRSYRVLETSEGYLERGIASWYGEQFQGRPTSSGEPYDMYGMTAAHKSLPLPTYVEVTNLENGRTVVVRVNDRGPFIDGRIIDLSFVAARKLGYIGSGTVEVEVRALDPPARDPGGSG